MTAANPLATMRTALRVWPEIMEKGGGSSGLVGAHFSHKNYIELEASEWLLVWNIPER